MLFHISSQDGVVSGVHKLFHVIEHRHSSHRVVYFNNTTSSALSRALSESTTSWVKDPQRTMQFEYERVSSVFDIVAKISASDYDLVVVEQLDAIMQEQTLREYSEQNQALAHLMATPRDMVFIDSWSYLDTYYHRKTL